jgi:hypothetical protein
MKSLPVRNLIIAGVIVGLLILSVYLWGTHGRFDSSTNHTRQSGASLGRIVIDSPEVYTRERLVNDRFYEDAWLRERLQKINELEIGIQGFVRSRLKRSADIQMGFGHGQTNPISEESRGGESKSEEKSQLAKKETEGLPPQGLFRDLFKQLLDIRSAIRSEIIENQLDDRHDIASNTLYNFKFDTTVITSGDDTSAWACSQISISKPDDEVNVEALPALYTDWTDFMRALLRREYMRRVNTITKRYLSDVPDIPEMERFVEFLRFDFSNITGPPDKKDSREISNRAHELIDKHKNDLADMGRTTRKLDEREFQIAQVAAAIIHKQQLKEDTPLKIAINWLIAKWVEFELVLEPKFDRILSVVVADVGGGNFRIDVATRVEAKDVSTGTLDAFEEINLSTEIVDIGFEEFCRRLSRPDQTVFTYSVNPKQSVERISDVVAQEVANLIGLKMDVSGGETTGALGTDVKRSLSALTHAIRRKPIIVGYADRKRQQDANEEAVFGWLIGPRFQADQTYRHVPVQNALSALVSLPAGWPYVKIKVNTSWLREDGSEDKHQSYHYHIRLPGDFEKLTTSLRERGVRTRFGTGPEIDEHNLDDITLRIGDEASILIPGRNLWRSTVVTVGAQPSHMITVLPNMEGIIAHFKEIKPLYDGNANGEKNLANVRVWTSEGVAHLTKRARLITTEVEKSN